MITVLTVLGHGNLMETEICKSCGCRFLYNKRDDVKTSYLSDREHTPDYLYINCPECGDKVVLKKL